MWKFNLNKNSKSDRTHFKLGLICRVTIIKFVWKTKKKENLVMDAIEKMYPNLRASELSTLMLKGKIFFSNSPWKRQDIRSNHCKNLNECTTKKNYINQLITCLGCI